MWLPTRAVALPIGPASVFAACNCGCYLARCTATGVVPSFEAEVCRDSLTLFACTAPQYCALSLLQTGRKVAVNFDTREVEATIDTGQQSSKRQRRG